jgi:hypothetical protein
MVSVKECVIRSIGQLSDAELQMVADYLAFLKFRAHAHVVTGLNETQLAELYAEAAEDDRVLAAEGLADYAVGLHKEDAQ